MRTTSKQQKVKPHPEHLAMLKTIRRLVKQDGERSVSLGLQLSGLASSTAEKIVRGDYRVVRFRRKTAARIIDFLKRASQESA